MSVDLIKRVGIRGHYLDTGQTLQFFNFEHEESALLDRRSRGVWLKTGEKSVQVMAKKIAFEIIARENEYTLKDYVREEIERTYRRST